MEHVEIARAESARGELVLRERREDHGPPALELRANGVFVMDSVEVATERVSAVQVSVPDNELDYYFLLGDSPKEALASYNRLSGKPALPPPWSFGASPRATTGVSWCCPRPC